MAYRFSTDIHSVEQCQPAAAVCDILQIPAFLCRQTDLIQAAARTGQCINVKKGQFLSPTDAQHAIAKVEATGNHNILLTERGTTFGYGNLVVDMRALAIMREFGYPVVFDATHSVQMPGAGGYTGGDRRMRPCPGRCRCRLRWRLSRSPSQSRQGQERRGESVAADPGQGAADDAARFACGRELVR